MLRSIDRALIATVATSLATLAAAEPACAQKNSTPTGWVGLSVIQTARATTGSNMSVAYPIVASVEPGSPAQTAGLVAGDTIEAYNDIDAGKNPLAVKRFLKPGAQLVIKVRRNGVRNLTLTVARRSAKNTYAEAVTISTSENGSLPLMSGVPGGPIAIGAPVSAGREAPFAGAYLATMNSGLASALDVHNSGVLVVSVGNGSNAMKAGLAAGDVITRADSIAVDSPLGIATAMRLASGRSITLRVTRGGESQKITITW